MSIAGDLSSVQDRVRRAACAVGRDPKTVRLLAASKTQPMDALRQAHAAGQRLFGESRAQELRDKARVLGELPDLQWHFIGALQKNKIK